uniref:Probable E3 ubiquitin-protein ligase HERC3 n=1 Tax=Sinocyclocheilus rhinocerous TaxID=307959 RepID=A0A673FJX0_9TELE
MLCWGSSASGQLGIGASEASVFEPRSCCMFDGRGLKEVACGSHHSLFLFHDGSVYASGSNSCGQLGHDKGGWRPELVGALDAQKIAGVSCGQAHSLVVNEQGQVFAWGAGEGGQLGLGAAEEAVRVPRLIKKLCEHRISQVMCGKQHCIALSKDGQLFVWGENSSGQLGLGKGEPSTLSPQPLKSLCGIPLAQISAGGDHSFALSLSGAVFGWGKNSAGQLGLNDEQDRAVPCHIKFLRSQKVVYISCGEEHTAALTKVLINSQNIAVTPLCVRHRHHTLAFVPSTGLVYAFGCNTQGQLGTGLRGNAKSPLPVRNIQPLCIGNTHTSILFQTIWRLISTCCFHSDDGHFKTNPKVPGIDFNAVRLLFETLMKPAFARLLEQATKSFESLLIPQLTCSPPDVEAMRIYLILSECPALQDSKNYISLTIPLAMAILRLDANPSKVLDNWWSLMDCEVFSRLVEMYKSIVVFLLTGGKALLMPVFLESYTSAALRLLEKLHKVNLKVHRVEYNHFYIPDISRLVDIQEDYLKWFLRKADIVCDNLNLISQGSVTLCAYPFILNAQAKTTVLQTDAELQMQMAVSGANLHNVFMLLTMEPLLARNPFLVLHVRRNLLVSDALRELTVYNDVDLKKPLKVIFDGEEAVDAGGVTKEFFLLLLKELMDPIYGMFTQYSESNLLWFSDKCFVEHNWFHLIGIICGLAIYNSTVVDLHFPLVLYKKLLNVSPTLDDLKELSPTEGRSLQQLLEYEGDVEETFCLNFARERVNKNVSFLCWSLRKEFVHAYLQYVFSDSVQELYSAFSSGFLKVCGGEILSLFQPSDCALQFYLDSALCFSWLCIFFFPPQNASYKGEFSASHPTVKKFWEVFHEFPLEKKKQFLLFLTGSDRIPIHGMASLRIVIQSTAVEEHYLPVAHTCYNMLDMPCYQTKETLRHRLTQAVEQYEGFSLV